MIRVALVGNLAAQVDAFRAARIPTDVVWSAVPEEEPEQARLDLLLLLQGDAAAERQIEAFRQRHEGQPVLVQQWEGVPSLETLDLALQDSLTAAFGFVVGYTPAMHEVCCWIRAVAHQVTLALDLRTLVVGETGSGKELVAQAIHCLGPRGRAPFVPLNCGALPRELIGSELFGHVKGAYTGAVADRDGALRRAGKGTLFLDEVGELPLDLQAQFLRVLEQRTFSPLGSDRTFPLQAQIISATNRTLEVAIRDKLFRADLYYRLAQVPVVLPALRERRADLPLLVRHFLRQHGLPPTLIDSAVLQLMGGYAWPGNIRELRSAIDRFILLRRSGQRPTGANWFQPVAAGSAAQLPLTGTLAELREDFEKRVVQAVLARCDGDTERAAQELGVTRRSIYNLLRRHNLNPDS